MRMGNENKCYVHSDTTHSSINTINTPAFQTEEVTSNIDITTHIYSQESSKTVLDRFETRTLSSTLIPRNSFEPTTSFKSTRTTLLTTIISTDKLRTTQRKYHR